ncbi:MAG: alpha-2-macroglobulin [Verrucomicrobiae bacterium]|nr:alpha-2-macroglobulin [Verrucomicrobiae bacterium]
MHPIPASLVRLYRRFIQPLSAMLLGSLSWSPPGWFNRLVSHGIQKPRTFIVLGAVLCLAGLGCWKFHVWQQAQPKPRLISGQVSGPDISGIFPQSFSLTFDHSAARLEDIDKAINSGTHLSPSQPGVWKWSGDRSLQFTPNAPWPAGTKFRVTLDRKLFTPQTRLAQYKFDFQTPPLTASFDTLEVYIDPRNPKTKQVTGTIRFNYPVRRQDLHGHLTYSVIGQEQIFPGKTTGESVFEITTDPADPKLLYLRSAPISLPAQESFLKVIVPKGLPTLDRSGKTFEAVTKEVTIPTLSSIFHFKSSSVQVIKNRNNLAEQVLILQTSVPVKPSDLAKNLRVWLLPKRDNDGVWSGPAEITPEILQKSQSVRTRLIASDKEFDSQFALVLEVPAGKQIFIRVARDLKSLGDFALPLNYDAVLNTPEFPAEIAIQGEGSLLALSGERKLSVALRAVPVMESGFARIRDSEINHLISQSAGSISNPYFQSATFGEENISQIFTRETAFSADSTQASAPAYTPVDFTEYLKALGHLQHGLFILNLRGWDKTLKQADAEAEELDQQRIDLTSNPGQPTPGTRRLLASDRRLILVTDMALIVKQNADHSRDVFLHSLEKGGPVSAAKISVIGKNGLPLATVQTDAEGCASLPDLDDFKNEKEPVAILAQKGDDLTFLPFHDQERQINYSRFDIGGEAADKPDQLSALVFSDRGLYRPGDEAKLALILKRLDWKGPLDGLPLEIRLTDPRGHDVSTWTIQSPGAGFYEWTWQSREQSPTGQYHVQAYLVHSPKFKEFIGSTALRVEEFLPDRLKIKSHLNPLPTEGWITPKKISISANLQNLYGLPATGHRMGGRVQLIPAAFSFSKFKGYLFQDPYLSSNPGRQSREIALKDTESDPEGNSSLDIDLASIDNSAWRLDYLVEGFEKEGGRSVSSHGSTIVSPMPYLIGSKADGELSFIKRSASRTLHLLPVNSRLEPVAVDRLTLQFIEKRYLSVLTAQPNGNYAYESVLKETVIEEKPLTLGADGSKITLRTEEPGEFILRVRDQNARLLTESSYSVAGEGNLSRPLDRQAELKVSLPSRDFKPGEIIEVQVVAPYTGSGLISIEREKVYAHTWFKTSTLSSIQKIRVPEGLEGGAYLNITFVRDLGSKEIFMSPLSSAVIPFRIDRAARTIKIDLAAPDQIKPGESLPVKVKTSRPSQVIVYGVDTGILQVARYETPDPLEYFLRKRSLGVSTAQMADMLLPEYSLLRQLSSPGGDGGLEELRNNLNPFKRKRQKPVVFWSGIIEAGPAGKTLHFDIPDTFDGSLRLMAVAVNEVATGSAEKETLVRGDLILRPNLPTFAAPGDVFNVPVTVADNREGTTLSTDPISLSIEVTPNLELLSPGTVELKSAPGQEVSATFRVKAREPLGNGEMTFTARSGNVSRRDTSSLSIRPASAYFTSVVSGSFTGGQTELRPDRALHGEFRSVEATMSALPSGLNHGLSAYLQNYPHFCSEQLISRSMATVALEGQSEFGLPKAETVKRIMETLAALAVRQNDQGGIGMWYLQGNLEFDFPSVYLVHFLLEARDRGYNIPGSMLDRALLNLQRMAAATPGNLSDARTQAYAIYLLTRNGQITSNYLSRLRDTLEKEHAEIWKQDITSAYVASTYALLQNRREAARLLGDFKMTVSQGEWPELYGAFDDFNSPLGRNAQFVYLVSKHFPERLRRVSENELDTLLTPVMEGDFNTLSAAYAILALEAYSHNLGRMADADPKIQAVSATGQVSPLPLENSLPPRASIPATAAQVRFGAKRPTNPGFKRFFCQIIQTGFDRDRAEKPISDHLEVQREFRNRKNQVVTQAALGEELTAHIRLRTTNGMTVPNIAIIDLLPGGFEVESEASQNRSFGSPVDYGDIREDRVVLYTSATGGAREYSYKIKATAAGEFQIPPVQAESMYNRNYRARGKSGRFTVTVMP